MDARKLNRQGGDLKAIKIRFPQDTLDDIRESADRLGISIASYVNHAVSEDGQRDLRKRVNNLEKHSYEIFVPLDMRSQFDDLTKELNESSRQLRAIGTNISVFIRDIRSGKIPMDVNAVYKTLKNGKKVTVGQLIIMLEENLDGVFDKHKALADKYMNLIFENPELSYRAIWKDEDYYANVTDLDDYSDDEGGDT